MKLISFLARNSRKALILAITAGIVAGASNTALLALINRALTHTSTAALVWAFVALCVALPISRFVSENLLITLGQGALYDLRMELSRKILAVPLKQLEELGAPRLLTALNEDVPTITNAVMMIPLLCINTTVILGGLIYLGILSWKLVLVVLVFLALGVLSYQLPVQRGMRPLMKAREAADSLQVHFQGLTRGVKELKLHRERRRAFLSEVMHETAGSLRTHNISGLRIFAAAASWGQTIVIIVVGIFVFGLPAFKIVDSQIMTGYALILLYLMTPIQVLITSLPTLGRATVAINKIDALGLSLSASGSDDDANSIAEKNGAWKSLDLAGVTHTYHSEDSAFTLGPIDLTLKPGEVVFLVGGNGSGKTTLAKLLVGLYAPESGQVKLNGRAVTTESRDDYRQLFSVVFFDFFLFESLLGLETEGLDQKAREYLESLQLSHKVKVNHGRLSTTELSAGQRKRLALLTAYLEDRPIYVFDEWAADQDPIFKDIFYYHIVSGLRDRAKTVVVISHDDRYYHLGDRIIKLENGMVEYDKLVSPVLAAKSETVAY